VPLDRIQHLLPVIGFQNKITVLSQGFDYLRLSKDREGLISNYQRLIDGYIAGQPLAVLARANTKLGGNFDGPILDLGF